MMINGLVPMSTTKVAKMGLSRGFPKDFQAWKNKFPREENKLSSVGKLSFQRWKTFFPALESFLSYVGNENSYVDVFLGEPVWREA